MVTLHVESKMPPKRDGATQRVLSERPKRSEQDQALAWVAAKLAEQLTAEARSSAARARRLAIAGWLGLGVLLIALLVVILFASNTRMHLQLSRENVSFLEKDLEQAWANGAVQADRVMQLERGLEASRAALDAAREQIDLSPRETTVVLITSEKPVSSALLGVRANGMASIAPEQALPPDPSGDGFWDSDDLRVLTAELARTDADPSLVATRCDIDQDGDVDHDDLDAAVAVLERAGLVSVFAPTNMD